MKKILSLILVVVLSACGFSQKEIAMHDDDFKGCQRIATHARHLVYKCPSGMEWVWETARQHTDTMFKTLKEIDLDTAIVDKEHVLVVVVFGKSKFCSEKFHYRTIKSVNGKAVYTVIGCK